VGLNPTVEKHCYCSWFPGSLLQTIVTVSASSSRRKEYIFFVVIKNNRFDVFQVPEDSSSHLATPWPWLPTTWNASPTSRRTLSMVTREACPPPGPWIAWPPPRTRSASRPRPAGSSLGIYSMPDESVFAARRALGKCLQTLLVFSVDDLCEDFKCRPKQNIHLNYSHLFLKVFVKWHVLRHSFSIISLARFCNEIQLQKLLHIAGIIKIWEPQILSEHPG